MKEKRPIDRLRESGAHADIGTPDDASPISGFLKIDDELYVVKELGIYRFKLADEIDPDRTNDKIPNIHERLLQYGSEARFVARTLLTAAKLFEQERFPAHINTNSVLKLAFTAARELAAMTDIAHEIAVAEQKAKEDLQNARKTGRSINLPQIPNLYPRVKNFVQVMDHAYKALFETTEEFFGRSYRKRWFESFSLFSDKRFGEADRFSRFVKSALPLLRLLRFMRDCVEHPSEKGRVTVYNFELTADGKILTPTIEVTHAHVDQPRSPLVSFMHEIIENLSIIYENMLAYLADMHVQPFGVWQIRVHEFPPERIGEKYVRFSYGMVMGDEIVPFG